VQRPEAEYVGDGVSGRPAGARRRGGPQRGGRCRRRDGRVGGRHRRRRIGPAGDCGSRGGGGCDRIRHSAQTAQRRRVTDRSARSSRRRIEAAGDRAVAFHRRRTGRIHSGVRIQRPVQPMTLHQIGSLGAAAHTAAAAAAAGTGNDVIVRGGARDLVAQDAADAADRRNVVLVAHGVGQQLVAYFPREDARVLLLVSPDRVDDSTGGNARLAAADRARQDGPGVVIAR